MCVQWPLMEIKGCPLNFHKRQVVGCCIQLKLVSLLVRPIPTVFKRGVQICENIL